MKKAQGSFEYVLLLAGVLLVVVIAVVVLRSSFPPVDEHVRFSNCRALLTGAACYDVSGNWASGNIVLLTGDCASRLGGNNNVICGQGGDSNKCTCGDKP
jgi:hypothetical protein